MTDEEFAAIKARDEAFCTYVSRGAQTTVEKDCTDLIREVERLRPVLKAARRIANAASSREADRLLSDLVAAVDAYDDVSGSADPRG